MVGSCYLGLVMKLMKHIITGLLLLLMSTVGWGESKGD